LTADFRYGAEREADPSPWPDEWDERVVAYSGSSGQTAAHNQLLRDGTMTVEASRRCYDQVFRAVRFDSSYREVIGCVFKGFAGCRSPVLVHCSAGKDRTGMVVALMHHALGVPREQICQNFLLSNDAEGLHAMAEQVRAREAASRP